MARTLNRAALATIETGVATIVRKYPSLARDVSTVRGVVCAHFERILETTEPGASPGADGRFTQRAAIVENSLKLLTAIVMRSSDGEDLSESEINNWLFDRFLLMTAEALVALGMITPEAAGTAMGDLGMPQEEPLHSPTTSHRERRWLH